MMTILKRVFGFSPETEEDDDYDPAAPQYAAAASAASGEKQSGVRAEEKETSVATEDGMTGGETDASLPEDIFDAVIKLFNDAQPDFVKKCLSLEAQRKYIIDSISASLRGRVDSVMKSSLHKWDDEKAVLEKKIAELEGGDNVISTLRQENRRLQLSVDRQKRALLDRINDLETQVARQAEEKERFYSKKPIPGAEALAKANTRIKELEEEKSALEAEKEAIGNVQGVSDEEKAAFETTKAELTAECERLREEAARQSTLREQLEVKVEMSDAMINDLRNQASSSRQELEKMQHEQETVMEQIRSQLDGFEALKARKDAKIAELQDANASLRRTIEANLYNHADSEMKLRDEIKELQARLESAEAAGGGGQPVATDSAAPAEKPSRRRGRPKKVRIDSELDNTEWFSSGKDDPDFGYHEPPRRPVNDNEAQLSLF